MKMRSLCIVLAGLIAGCGSSPTQTKDEQPGETGLVSENLEQTESSVVNEVVEVAEEEVVCHVGGEETRPDAQIQAGQYINLNVRKVCDYLTVNAERAHTIHRTLQLYDEALEIMGEAKVDLVLGREAKVYRTREELIADPEAGADAAAVLPKDFDFESHALARYQVLHSSLTQCRDQRLGMTGEQAKAMDKYNEKWREKARELQGVWRFVPDAVETVRDGQVIDPVLPAERNNYPAATDPCEEFWIEQPALTPVSREGRVGVYGR